MAIRGNLRHCIICHSPMPDDAIHCIRCGSDQPQTKENKSRSKRDFSWIWYVALGIVVLLCVMADSRNVWTAYWFKGGAILGSVFGISLWYVISSWRKRNEASSAAGGKKKPSGCLAQLAGFYLLAFAVFFFIVWTSPSKPDIETSLSPVIAALSKYRSVNARYPESLNKLAPEYLSVLPGCAPGEPAPQILYWLDKDSGEYQLICPLLITHHYYYNSKTKQWGNCGDKWLRGC